MTVEVTGMDAFMKQLTNLAISPETAKHAVNAAADVFVEHLIPNIPIDETRKQGKHLEELVTYKSGQYPDGSTDVGFTNDGYYGRFVNEGHFVTNGYKYEIRKKGRAVGRKKAIISSMKDANNGTAKISGQHFMEHTFDEAKEAMQEAMFHEVRKDLG
ncbi:MAG: HK97-gp10 family putative phage morphogenesis protein [Sporolactobacillus sp.]